MPGKPKPTAKRASRASGPRKPAAKAKKTAKAGTKAKSPPKAGAKAKPGASEAKPMTGKAVSRLIDQRIRDLGGWRGETLARMRALILEADPEMIEEWKWRGTPVWSHHGIVCTGEAYTKVVKLTFARGAGIPDPSRLFNSSLDGNTRQGDRYPRRGEGRRSRVQGAREGRGCKEWLAGEKTVAADVSLVSRLHAAD
jgi:hypothetical protein